MEFRKLFLIALALTVLGCFLYMVRSYLMAVVLAAIFTAMFEPLYRRVLRMLRGRKIAASVTTLLVLLISVGVPLVVLLGVVTAQGIVVTEQVVPWLVDALKTGALPSAKDVIPAWLPYAEELAPYRNQLAGRIGELLGTAGSHLVASLSAFTQETADFVLKTFVMLYAMFWFFIEGGRLKQRVARYLPLDPEELDRALIKGIQVTRATLKSILVIGGLQGLLVAGALATAGISGAVFWGMLVVVFSALPGIGAPFVWAPAAIWLFADGRVSAGVLMVLWGALVVGTVDNVLRPRIVSQETKMPDLIILVSTLGGIGMFGPIGILAGPLLAGLLVTTADAYANALAPGALAGTGSGAGPAARDAGGCAAQRHAPQPAREEHAGDGADHRHASEGSKS